MSNEHTAKSARIAEIQTRLAEIEVETRALTSRLFDLDNEADGLRAELVDLRPYAKEKGSE